MNGNADEEDSRQEGRHEFLDNKASFLQADLVPPQSPSSRRNSRCMSNDRRKKSESFQMIPGAL